ncbi:MAG: transglycosylase SLT domain-containing protein [Prevotella sp.]|nr:transglycosylase SLT domain-containing protein [Prevotella sp.]
MKETTLALLVLITAGACTKRLDKVVPPWQSETTTSEIYDLPQIEQTGEMIALTLTGPDTYYDYQGSHLGVHYLLAQQFASYLGVRLRIEVCRDTTELLRRLDAGKDADLGVLSLTSDTAALGWMVGNDKPALENALREWYQPQFLADAKETERQMLTQRRVTRRVHAPMLSRGVISLYDEMFKRYSRGIGWDWRLLAAQCYQESTFDPEAVSWAGAKGLMQIMPKTADHLGLARDMMTDPEQNIAAATRYLHELEHEFSYIHDRTERQNMVLASYNGGIFHIQDAMRLAERDNRNAQRWNDVREYVLKLKEPQYYQDTLVRYGYMRGTETADYVDKIRARYQKYARMVRQ